MATIQTVRPDAVLSYITDAGANPGPGGLADDNDGTYGRLLSNVSPASILTDFASFTMSADQRCASVKFRVRARALDGFSTDNLHNGLVDNGSTILTSEHGVNTNPVTVDSAWRNDMSGGGEWTQARINALRVNSNTLGAGAWQSDWAVIEHYVDFNIRTRATVAITSPTVGQAVPSATPTIFWNYNNQGDTVSRWHMKIFTAAVVTGGGFDPTTSATVYDSSATPGAASSKQVTTALTPGASYYAYVRIATDFNGTDWWSNWSSVQFLVSQLPVVSGVGTSPATPITTTNYPFITGTYTDPDGETAQWVHIKIFSQAVYDAGGFNPDTSTAAWDRISAISTTSGSTFSVLVDTLLSKNTNYKAWVRASEVGAGQRWGNWASSASPFLIQTASGITGDPPAKPLIIATADQTNQRVVLDVQARDNILTRNQASIDTGVVGWENIGNTTVSRDTTTFLAGGASLKMTAIAAGDMSVRSGPGGLNGFPVLPNKQYTAMGRPRANTTGRNTRVEIRWYDAAGASISTSTGANVADVNTGFTVTPFITATSPANAAYAAVVLVVLAAAIGEIHFWDNISLAPGNLLVWYRGGLAKEMGALSDSFNRADNAASLGSADVGGAWTAAAGTWSILSNKARMTTVTLDAYAILTSGFLADGYVEVDVTLSAARADVGVLFKYLDTNNTLMLELYRAGAGNNINLYKRTAGSWSTLATTGATAGLVLGQTYKVRVEFYGGQIYVYVDGVLRLSYLMLLAELDQFGAYNKYGIYVSASGTADDNASRFDNFKAGALSTQRVTIERSLDGGDTWLPMRDMEKIALNDQVGILYDYEISLYTTPQYRMQTFGTEVNEVASEYSTAAPLNEPLVATSWWLKDPADPSLNTPVKVMPPFNFSRKEPQQIYEPLGRRTSVVVTDGPRGIVGTLNLMTKNQAEYDRLNLLIDNGRTLLLVDVFGRSWYIKFGESHDWTMVTAVATEEEVYPVRHLHTVSLPFVEVSAP